MTLPIGNSRCMILPMNSSSWYTILPTDNNWYMMLPADISSWYTTLLTDNSSWYFDNYGPIMSIIVTLAFSSRKIIKLRCG